MERDRRRPDPGPAAADVLAALVDGFDQVLIGPDARLAPSDRRRIRARDRDVALIDTTGANCIELARTTSAPLRLVS